MVRQLRATSRADLRRETGVNTHFCFTPSVYSPDGTPDPLILDRVKAAGVGMVRERLWPNNPAQRAAFTDLTDAGVGLYLFVGDVNYPPEQARADVAALAETSYAGSVVALCGPNEPNAAGGNAWPDRVVAIQEAIWREVFATRSLASHVAVVGTALKHNVADVDADYRALAKAGVRRWCDAGDFHFYPGNAGPFRNAGEEVRASQAYGDLPMWHSETGWTGADTSPELAAMFSVEALLRNHLTGIVGTILYELADEWPTNGRISQHEGRFGLVTARDTKPAFTRMRSLLAPHDGREAFPGWLAEYARGVESDAGVVVTSEGDGRWTVYLLRASQPTATLVLPPGHTLDEAVPRCNPAGERSDGYSVVLDSMSVVHVTAATSNSARTALRPPVPVLVG